MDQPPYWQLLENIEPTGRLDRAEGSTAGANGSAAFVAIANQKGGVGKTTTAVNLGAGLALRGHRVLLVDVDPQCNATTGLGVDHRSRAPSAYELLLGETPLGEVVVDTAVAGLSLVPASMDLAGAEVELAGALSRELKLRAALLEARSGYAMVLIDCPPSLGLLTVNALAAADDLVAPVQCEYYALEGLGQLLGNAERVRRAINPGLRVTGFVMTMHDGRTKLSSQVTSEVRAHFGDVVFRTVIPRSVRISEAPSYGEPVLTLDPLARGAAAYRLLAAEVAERYGLTGEPSVTEQTGSAGNAATPDEGRPAERGPAATPGPSGRGYGTTTPVPAGLDRAWPPAEPWSAS